MRHRSGAVSGEVTARRNSPAFALAKRRHVSDVMPAMPGIEGEHVVEREGRVPFGMVEPALEVGWRHGLHQHHPSFVERLEKRH